MSVKHLAINHIHVMLIINDGNNRQKCAFSVPRASNSLSVNGQIWSRFRLINLSQTIYLQLKDPLV